MVEANVFYTAMLVVLCCWVLFWTIYICLFSIVGRLPYSIVDITQGIKGKRIIVLVTAHDAAEQIEGCIAAIKAASHEQREVRIIVVADHCMDDTKALAIGVGAEVYERNTGLRGKSFSLKWFFEEIYPVLPEGYPVVITDATARIDASALGFLISALYDGFDVSVGRAAVRQGDYNWLHAGTDLALRHRANQNLCRRRFGFNPLIEGRLMAFSPSFLRHYGWSLAAPDCLSNPSVHPTEDWRHGLKISQNHIKIKYVHSAIVWTPLRSSISANTAQIRRWDQGRLANAKSLGWPTLMAALLSRDLRLIVAALDSVQPPQIHIVMCSLLLVLIGMVFSSAVAWKIGITSVLVFAIYYVIILRIKSLGNFNYKIIDLMRWASWRCATVMKRLFSMQ